MDRLPELSDARSCWFRTNLIFPTGTHFPTIMEGANAENITLQNLPISLHDCGSVVVGVHRLELSLHSLGLGLPSHFTEQSHRRVLHPHFPRGLGGMGPERQ